MAFEGFLLLLKCNEMLIEAVLTVKSFVQFLELVKHLLKAFTMFYL